MKVNRRSRVIILWLIAIGLLIGMVISFTPNMGLFGGETALRGTEQILVNGQAIREAEILRVRQNALFNVVTEGEVARDLDLLLVEELVREQVLNQAAARINITGAQVRTAVDEFRVSRGVNGRGNDQAYLQLLRSAGFTDETFRDYLRQQLRIAAFEESVIGGVQVSEAEIEAFYLSHSAAYQSEERIQARQIVVADRDTAESLRQQVLSGSSFADLAAEHSLELADRRGALGASEGETEPRPVGRPALPTAVANAAFALRGAGLTDVVEAGAGFHLIQVESYLAADTLPFDAVSDRAAEDALQSKRAGVVEAELERLRRSADVSFPATSTLAYNNPVLAQVGEVEITAAQLSRATYTNPQIQQALSPQTADLIAALFKPAVLSQLIDTELAYQGAGTLGIELVGTRTAVAQAALDYVAREVSVTEAEIGDYYQTNIAAYTTSAEAQLRIAEFGSLLAAQTFRAAILAGGDVSESAALVNGTIDERGLVRPGSLETELDTALFDTDAFDPLPEGDFEVSDVLVLVSEDSDAGALLDELIGASDVGATGDGDEAGAAGDGADGADPEADSGAANEPDASADVPGDGEGEQAADAVEDTANTEETPAAPSTRYVVLVAARKPEVIRALEDVRSQAEAAVLAQSRQDARSAWLDGLRETVTVRDFTAEISPFDFIETPAPDPADGSDEAGPGSDAAGDGAGDSQPGGDGGQTTDENEDPAGSASEDPEPAGN